MQCWLLLRQLRVNASAVRPRRLVLVMVLLLLLLMMMVLLLLMMMLVLLETKLMLMLQTPSLTGSVQPKNSVDGVKCCRC